MTNFESNDLRALNDRELETVHGGLYDDGGCIPTMTIDSNGIHVRQPSGPNGWLTWGSAQRGGR